MQEKDTNELSDMLGKTHLDDFDRFIRKNQESMLEGANEFSVWFKEMVHSRQLSLKTVFVRADIPERYGYKLLSGEKRTRQRDVILRLCYAAELTLAQTDRALEKYGMARLYAKVPRDALLMILFNERPGGIIDVNEILQRKGMATLRTSGLQD